MTTYSVNGDYIGGSVSINDPYTSVATIHESLDATRTKAEEVLVLLIGDDGSGGLLGQMMSSLEIAPNVSINPISVDTNVTLAESGLPLPTFNDATLKELSDDLYPVPTFNDSALRTFTEAEYPVPTFDESALKELSDDLYPVPTFNDSALRTFTEAEYPIPVFDETALKDFSADQYPVPIFDDSALQAFPDESYSVPVLASLPGVDTSFAVVEEPSDTNLTLSWAEATLPSELFSAFREKILADMAGGTGLSAEVEAAIYARAKTRQQVDRLAEYDRINNAAGDMQFAYPSGVLLSALAGFGVGANRMDADIENTIIVSQGELAQKNVMNAMEQAKGLESLLRQTRNEESQRALDAMKSIAEISIQEFSARIQKFLGIWEGRKVKMQAQVEALRGVIESNKSLVDIFSKQYEALRTRVDAVSSQNKSLVDVFTGKIQAYGIEEQAVSSHNKGVVDVFSSRIQAYGAAEQAVSSHNKTLVDVFTGKAQAYGIEEQAISSHNKTLVDVFSGRAQAFGIEEQAISSHNKTLVDVFTGKSQAFGEAERAISSYNKGMIDVFSGKTQAYGEAERAIATRNDSRVKLLAEKIKNADLDLRGQIAEAEALIQSYTAEQSIRERIVGGVSNIAAQVSASLLSAVHTSLGASYNASESSSKSYGASISLSENHDVPHEEM